MSSSAEPSPSSDTAPASRYYYLEGGKPVGPVPQEMLRRMMAEGLVPEETPVCPEGTEDWDTGRVHGVVPDRTVPQAPASSDSVFSSPRQAYALSVLWLVVCGGLPGGLLAVVGAGERLGWPLGATGLALGVVLIAMGVFMLKAVLFAYHLHLRHPLPPRRKRIYTVVSLLVGVLGANLLLLGAAGLAVMASYLMTDPQMRARLLETPPVSASVHAPANLTLPRLSHE